MRTEEILRELSDEIAEVYDLDLAEEMTETFEDLVKKLKADSKQYWTLVVKLARIEKQRDEERKLREKVEKELEEEHRLRVDAEYDKEYYAMQLMEHMD